MKKIVLIYLSLSAIPACSTAAYNPLVANQEEKVVLPTLDTIPSDEFKLVDISQLEFSISQMVPESNQDELPQQIAENPHTFSVDNTSYGFDCTDFIFNFDDDYSTLLQESTSFLNDQPSSSVPAYNSHIPQLNLNDNRHETTLNLHFFSSQDTATLESLYQSDALKTHLKSQLHSLQDHPKAPTTYRIAKKQPKLHHALLKNTQVWEPDVNYFECPFHEIECPNPLFRSTAYWRHIKQQHKEIYKQLKYESTSWRTCKNCENWYQGVKGITQHKEQTCTNAAPQKNHEQLIHPLFENPNEWDPNKNYYQCPYPNHMIKCEDPERLSSLYWGHFKQNHHINTDEGKKLWDSLHAAAKTPRRCICGEPNIKSLWELAIHKRSCKDYKPSKTE